MKIFVLNSGSSSVKYKLYRMTDESIMASGVVERVGTNEALLHHRVDNGSPKTLEIEAPDHTAAVRRILDVLVDPDPTMGVISEIGEIAGVGHRVVHGGERYNESVLVDTDVLAAIAENIPLSPLHNPPNLAGIRACMAAMGQAPQVAVFDTAFFAAMPKRAWMYAVPMEWYTTHRVRKYGFHGTSHRYVTARTAELMGRPVEQLNLITCHLGNGCSMTAVQGGRAVEHSMGMTPLDGLVMGTRSGEIDPAVIFYMVNNAGMSLDEVARALNKSSGLLGVSGVSNDMRDCEAAAGEGNDRAALAIELFAYRVLRYIGSYWAVLGRLDAIVFTGGIGENNVAMRGEICNQLADLGVKLDPAANEAGRGREGAVSVADSPVSVWVVPTDEELMIARDTVGIVSGAAGS